jgi:hypothetical protein
MDNTSILTELRVALRGQGVWGSRAGRLMNDWQEHVDEDTAQRVEKGAEPHVAREAAWQALGSPNVLAVKAGCELANGSWLGRHPWVGGAVFPLMGWVALICATCALFFWIMPVFGGFEALGKEGPPTAAHIVLVSWQRTMNWVPWLAAMAWLARIALRMPGGWKLYWITSIVLTAFAPSIWIVVHWPQHGPQNGSVMFHVVGVLGVFIKAAVALFGDGARIDSWADWFRGLCAHPMPLVQTPVMALGSIAFYGRMSGSYRQAAATPGAVVLFLIVALVGVGFASL